ncbi:type III secretion system inner membrane ring lipoprotein SctJ [Microbulbifer sp. TRSA007]|uniref:type III secretion system inner membrane ring lipoprotein SctJ n=1 Tax=unclassified Microbulbifer TaxID=2619833 RepID=UPI00403A4516
MFNLRILLIVVCVLVSACKVDLYTGLEEQEGNEMLALLLSEGVSASKAAGKGGSITLLVEESQLTRAVELLSRHSYPRKKYATINEVFPQGGLIQSPMADSARYTFAMSQDIASTLSNIDGVLTAKVHLVLPTEEGNKNSKASNKNTLVKASVFIKYDSRVAMKSYIPQIKAMVANSVDQLDYENVAVVIFPGISNYSDI